VGRGVKRESTNLPTWVDATEALRLLRAARGMEENGITAARKVVPIDHPDDRGALMTCRGQSGPSLACPAVGAFDKVFL